MGIDCAAEDAHRVWRQDRRQGLKASRRIVLLASALAIASAFALSASAASTASSLPFRALQRQHQSLSNFGSNGRRWAGHWHHPKGADTTSGWGPSMPTRPSGPTTTRPHGRGTRGRDDGDEGGTPRYFSLWLDMGTPASTRAAMSWVYTATNTYESRLLGERPDRLASKTGSPSSTGTLSRSSIRAARSRPGRTPARASASCSAPLTPPSQAATPACMALGTSRA